MWWKTLEMCRLFIRLSSWTSYIQQILMKHVGSSITTTSRSPGTADFRSSAHFFFCIFYSGAWCVCLTNYCQNFTRVMLFAQHMTMTVFEMGHARQWLVRPFWVLEWEQKPPMLLPLERRIKSTGETYQTPWLVRDIDYSKWSNPPYVRGK